MPLYRVGADTLVDTSQNCVRRNGVERPLRHKAFRTLIYLIEHRGRAVSKEEILGAVWKDTAVTDDALVQCICDIRRALADDGRQPQVVKTIPKVGYCLVGPVDDVLAAPQLPQTAARGPQPPVSRDHRPRRALVAAVLLALIVAVTAFNYSSRRIASAAVSDRRVVAIAAFANRSGDADLEWLREGLPDMLVAGLTRSRTLTIISRAELAARGARNREDSTLSQAIAMARARKAQAVVIGSFTKGGNAIRIDAQLHDVAGGELLSAQSLTVPAQGRLLTDIDLLAARLAADLKGERIDPQTDRVSDAMTSNLDAYRSYSLALERAHAYDSVGALRLLERAVSLDPRFAMAYARMGYVYTLVRVNERDRARPYLQKAFELSDRLSEKDRLWIETWQAMADSDYESTLRGLRRIITKAPLETEAHWRLGLYLQYLGRTPAAIDAYERGLAIDLGAKKIWNELGFIYSSIGRYADAVAAHERYVALDNHNANAYDSLAITLDQAGRRADALAALDRALALQPGFHFAVVHKGDVFVQMGRYREALAQYRRYIAVAPSDWDRAMGYNHLAMVHLRLRDYAAAAAAARHEEALHNDFGTELEIALARNNRPAVERLRHRYFALAGAEGAGKALTRKTREHLLGLLALHRGEMAEALEHFRAAQQVTHILWGINSVEDDLAHAYLRLDRTADAITEYRRLLTINPSDALTHFHLAGAYRRSARLTEARASYQRFLDLWKDADSGVAEVVEARRYLRAGV